MLEKGGIIQIQEQKCIEMANKLSCHPGPEIAQELSLTKNDVRVKTRQMRALAGELNLQQTQVRSFPKKLMGRLKIYEHSLI